MRRLYFSFLSNRSLPAFGGPRSEGADSIERLAHNRDVQCCSRTGPELPKTFKAGEMATFIVTGLQGAWLVSKVERDLAFAENFKKTLFSTVLA
jgi:hypothetical protein